MKQEVNRTMIGVNPPGDYDQTPARVTRPRPGWSPGVARVATYVATGGRPISTYPGAPRTGHSGNCRPSNKNRRSTQREQRARSAEVRYKYRNSNSRSRTEALLAGHRLKLTFARRGAIGSGFNSRSVLRGEVK